MASLREIRAAKNQSSSQRIVDRPLRRNAHWVAAALALTTIVLPGGCSQSSKVAPSLESSPIGASGSESSSDHQHLHIGQVRAVLPLEKRVLVARIPGIEVAEKGSVIIRDRKNGTTWYGQLLAARSDRFLIAAGEPPYPELWQDVWLLRLE